MENNNNRLYLYAVTALIVCGVIFGILFCYSQYLQTNEVNLKFTDKRTFYELASMQSDSPEHTIAWYQLGRMDFLEGKFVSALYKFEKQIEYFGDTIPNVYYMIGLTYGYSARASGRSEEWLLAEENFRKAMEYFPDQPWPKVDLAWILFSQGKYKEMIPVTTMGLAQHPQNPWLLNMHGLALLNSAEDSDVAYPFFVRAEEEASKLSVQEWGMAYPGNDPASWATGLTEMKKAIAHNIDTARPLYEEANRISYETNEQNVPTVTQ